MQRGLHTHRSPRISSLSPSWHSHLGKGSKRELLVPCLGGRLGAGAKAEAMLGLSSTYPQR